jgi:MoaA/NifB/PqqE/SkfB family radical SAM enzyme
MDPAHASPDRLPPDATRLLEHEDAAHEKRNWVRLTFDCNNHCVFCLDTLSHDGQMRDPEDVKRQILDGARKGATRLILSGGEPTMHPRYVDFIRLGARAGYRKIQTVTNGRMFAYRAFLTRCLDAGLSELTFSIHGPNARIHDALVGVKGAFDQELQGLQNALEDGRPVVNIDIVLNRANVRHVPEMLERFLALGVREFDLLHVIPFGNAYREGREVLFYDLEALRPYLLAAFAYARRPDVHLWLNRFPVQHLEGFEHLIQDPYKLHDEVKGRKEEYHRLLTQGVDLDCREPARCKLCYLQQLCDTLYAARDQGAAGAFTAVRVDTTWEARQGPVWGGDPAGSKRARPAPDTATEQLADERARRRLPLAPTAPGPVSIEAQAARAGATVLRLETTDILRAREELRRFPSVRALDLTLDDDAGLAQALTPEGTLDGRQLLRVRASTPERAQALLALPHAFEVLVALSTLTAPWLLALPAAPARLALAQPTYERLSDSARMDVDLRAFFQRFLHPVPVVGVPACVTGRAPRPEPPTLDATMHQPDGQLEVFRFTRRYILDHYRTRSLRCRPCIHHDGCEGMQINYIRAHGYGLLQPVLPDGALAAAAE